MTQFRVISRVGPSDSVSVDAATQPKHRMRQLAVSSGHFRIHKIRLDCGYDRRPLRLPLPGRRKNRQGNRFTPGRSPSAQRLLNPTPLVSPAPPQPVRILRLVFGPAVIPEGAERGAVVVLHNPAGCRPSNFSSNPIHQFLFRTP